MHRNPNTGSCPSLSTTRAPERLVPRSGAHHPKG